MVWVVYWNNVHQENLDIIATVKNGLKEKRKLEVLINLIQMGDSPDSYL